MKKAVLIFLVMLLSMACNITLDFNETSLGNEEEQIGTTVALTLTSQAPPSLDQGQPPASDAPANPAANQQQAASMTPFPTATATDTLVPTMTATPTPTVTPTLELRAGEPDKKITFSDGDGGFYDDDDENTIITPKNGMLEIVSTMKVVGWHGWSMYYDKIDNFYLESTINVVNCSGSDQYGIVFRGPDYSKGYFFGLTCSGSYFLDYLDGKYKPIVGDTASQFINTGSGQTNRIGVHANGDHLTLYINDHKVQEINDSTYTGKGVFGVFIAAYQTPNFTIQLDEIAYWLTN
jgi:hypothetical protein